MIKIFKTKKMLLIILLVLSVKFIYSNEKKNIPSTDKEKTINDPGADYQKKAFKNYSLGIAGTILLPVSSLATGFFGFTVTMLPYIYQYDYNVFLVIYSGNFHVIPASLLGFIFSLIGAAAFLPMIITGFYYYKKYNKLKTLNPFIEQVNSGFKNPIVKTGFSYKF